jgi:hypothetical protein
MWGVLLSTQAKALESRFKLNQVITIYGCLQSQTTRKRKCRFKLQFFITGTVAFGLGPTMALAVDAAAPLEIQASGDKAILTWPVTVERHVVDASPTLLGP